MAGFISSTLPAKIVRASNTTLFDIAAQEFGDATLWYVIARLNGLTDPWIEGLQEIKVPQDEGLVSNGGILGL